MRKLGYQVPPFDWTVPGVTSISTDLHKFGYCPKQASIVMYRSKELRRFQIFTSTRTTCYTLINPTIMSTKTGGPIAGAWAVLNYLGEEGYKKIVRAVQEATQRMIAGVESIPELKVMGKPDMCLFAFTSDTLDLFQLCDVMLSKGFTVQSQFGKPGAPRNIHISMQFSAVKNVDAFLAALRQSIDETKDLAPIDVASMQAQLNAMLAANDPNLFEKAAALAGIQGQNLPPGMALINTLLESMSDDVQSEFLIDYFNNLYI
jgi:glutamate/tyrosine decarboxylase-like PLP-dependent enzyme